MLRLAQVALAVLSLLLQVQGPGPCLLLSISSSEKCNVCGLVAGGLVAAYAAVCWVSGLFHSVETGSSSPETAPLDPVSSSPETESSNPNPETGSSSPETGFFDGFFGSTPEWLKGADGKDCAGFPSGGLHGFTALALDDNRCHNRLKDAVKAGGYEEPEVCKKDLEDLTDGDRVVMKGDKMVILGRPDKDFGKVEDFPSGCRRATIKKLKAMNVTDEPKECKQYRTKGISALEQKPTDLAKCHKTHLQKLTELMKYIGADP